MAKRTTAEHHDRYFQVHHFMAKTDAWRALTAPARAVYVQIGLRYNGSNNGRIEYSVRDAASECILARDTAGRAFKELVGFGFIEETRRGSFSCKTRIASEWRLTAFKCNLTNSPKSCLFMQCGAQALASRHSRSRPQAGRRQSQTTASQTQDTVPNDGRDCPKRRPVASELSQTTASQFANCPKRRPVGADSEGSTVLNDGTHIIYHSPWASGPVAQPPANDAPTPPQPNAKKSARKPKGRGDDLTVVQPPSHGPTEPRRPADDAPTPDGALPPNAPSDRPAAPPKLVWTRPVVRELTGAEAIMRRAATLAAEQRQ
jgi:hypothetical protein